MNGLTDERWGWDVIPGPSVSPVLQGAEPSCGLWRATIGTVGTRTHVDLCLLSERQCLEQLAAQPCEDFGGLMSVCQERQKDLPTRPQPSHNGFSGVLGASKGSAARELPSPAARTPSHRSHAPGPPLPTSLTCIEAGIQGRAGSGLQALTVNGSTKPLPVFRELTGYFLRN